MVTKKVIVLPSGNRVTLGQYVYAWKELKRLVARGEDPYIKGWEWYEVRGSVILRELRRAVHDRINIRAARAA